MVNERTPLKAVGEHVRLESGLDDEEFFESHKRSASDLSFMNEAVENALNSQHNNNNNSNHNNSDHNHHQNERHVSFPDGELGGELGEDHDGDPLEDFHRCRNRSESTVFEAAMESLAEVKEAIVETFEEVKENITEGIHEIEAVLEESITPVKPREEGDHNQKLSAVALAVLVFYKVSGGPFGCEPAVKAAGPFYALLGFLLFPILWCIPEALVTAELGSAYPEPSGSVAWVEEAFGPRASLLCGYFHWVSGATDNAIYPSLFLKYIASYSESGGNFLDGNLVRFVFTVIITLVLSAINYSGLEIVGNLSIIVCIISMSPFLLLFIWSIPHINTDRWFILPEAGWSDENDAAGQAGFLPNPVLFGVMWRPFLNSLFWNMNSFDVGASFAGEVRDPQRVFPRAMFLSIAFVVLGYLLPLGAALGATDTRQEDWQAGYFAEVSTKIAGPWLGAWTVFAAAVSNIALFEAEMSGDAYQLMGMADRGLIPKLFTKRSRFGTPENGILLGTFVIIAMSVADFDQLVEMLNFAYSLSLLMEFAAFVKLRISDDDVERPYKIPLNVFGCVLFVLPPSIFLIYLMLIASKMTFVYFAGLTIFGLSFHGMQKFAKHYGWMEYVEAPKRKKKKPDEVAATGEEPAASGIQTEVTETSSLLGPGA